jgi:hypothetical protein
MYDVDLAETSLNEFDAFLSGHYVEYLLQQGRAVPSWAWINQLAHATPEELAAIAAGARPMVQHPYASAWQRAIGAIARSLLADVDRDDRRLCELQRQVLVPVELALAQEWDRPLPPAKVRDLVLWALETRPRS